MTPVQTQEPKAAAELQYLQCFVLLRSSGWFHCRLVVAETNGKVSRFRRRDAEQSDACLPLHSLEVATRRSTDVNAAPCNVYMSETASVEVETT